MVQARALSDCLVVGLLGRGGGGGGSLLGGGSLGGGSLLGGGGGVLGSLLRVDVELGDVGLGLLLGDTGLDGDGADVGERLGEGVRERGDGREAEGEGHGGDGLEGGADLGAEDLVGDVEDGRGEDVAVVVDVDDHEAVGERHEVELLAQDSLGVADAVAGAEDAHRVDDLNLALGNLGGDVERLEESGLSRVAAGAARRAVHVNRGDGADTGRGRDTVLLDHLADVREGAVGEDEADVLSHERGELGDRVVFAVLGEEAGDDLADHGVLAHEDLGGAAKSLTGLLELV